MNDPNVREIPRASAALDRAAGVLASVLDVVSGRVEDGDVPPWCDARGWTSFLLSLSDDEAAACEAGALDAVMTRAPRDLVELFHATREATVLPHFTTAPRPLAPAATLRVPARKRLQIEAFLGAIAQLAQGAARLVDVGAGHGHLTRVASHAFDRDALGLELDPARVAVANQLAGAESNATFVVRDAWREPLALERDDLALGLHACGEVGDRLVVEAARAGAATALVSCCLQKLPGAVRAPLARRSQGLAIPKGALGLANLGMQPDGIETPLVVTMAARCARLALRRLLGARGLDVKPGEEMRGLNRRRARAGFEDLAFAAFAQRGLSAPTRAELDEVGRDADRRFARARRLTLPRSMLARLVEVTLVLDRAAALEEAGYVVRFGTLFDAAVSPRNVAIVASREEAGLPSVEER